MVEAKTGSGQNRYVLHDVTAIKSRKWEKRRGFGNHSSSPVVVTFTFEILFDIIFEFCCTLAVQVTNQYLLTDEKTIN